MFNKLMNFDNLLIKANLLYNIKMIETITHHFEIPVTKFKVLLDK